MMPAATTPGDPIRNGAGRGTEDDSLGAVIFSRRGTLTTKHLPTHMNASSTIMYAKVARFLLRFMMAIFQVGCLHDGPLFYDSVYVLYSSIEWMDEVVGRHLFDLKAFCSRTSEMIREWLYSPSNYGLEQVSN